MTLVWPCGHTGHVAMLDEIPLVCARSNFDNLTTIARGRQSTTHRQRVSELLSCQVVKVGYYIITPLTRKAMTLVWPRSHKGHMTW